MNKERGDLKWINDEIIWVSSDVGNWIIHPVLGLMKSTDPMRDAIIGLGLAKEIDQKSKEYINEKL